MLQIGQMAPNFKAKALIDNGEFKTLSLEDYKGRWLVLFFYPLDFSIVCPTELTQFRECLPQFSELGVEVVGCSVDSVYSHKSWVNSELKELNYPLIGDLTKRVAKDYGVLMENKGFATRGTFIIDPEGTIQYIGIHNTTVARDVNELLRVINGLKSGELCGAGWKPGNDHIKMAH